MKRVSIILAMFFVLLISFSACESEVEEMVADQPNAEKLTADEDEHDGHDWD